LRPELFSNIFGLVCAESISHGDERAHCCHGYVSEYCQQCMIHISRIEPKVTGEDEYEEAVFCCDGLLQFITNIQKDGNFGENEQAKNHFCRNCLKKAFKKNIQKKTCEECTSKVTEILNGF